MLCVYVSEVSSLIGANPFVSREEAMHKVMVRHGFAKPKGPTQRLCREADRLMSSSMIQSIAARAATGQEAAEMVASMVAPTVVVATPSPPQPTVATPSSPPPLVVATPSSPPPLVVTTPSSPQPAVATPSLPPPLVVTTPSSPPPLVTTPSSPPPLVVTTPSSPPLVTTGATTSPIPPIQRTPSPVRSLHTPSPTIEDICNELQRRVVCEVGTQREEIDRARYETDTQTSVQGVQQAVRGKFTTPKNKIPWVLFGRTDGLTDGCVQEFKNRKRRLFGCIPSYELPQLICYMALSGTHQAIQIESHNTRQQIHPLAFDMDEWLTILEDLHDAVEEMTSQLDESTTA